MLLPKSTLEQVECYSVIHQKVAGTFADVNDIITLHFKSWWKNDRVILISRNSVDIDQEAETFNHFSTDEAVQLLEQLEQYMESTFHDNPGLIQNAKVLSIVPKD